MGAVGTSRQNEKIHALFDSFAPPIEFPMVLYAVRESQYQRTMTPTPAPTETEGVDKDAIIASLVEETRKLQATVSNLQQKIAHGESFDTVRTDVNEMLLLF